MKLALLSDIHANRQALQACIAHARAQGAGRFAFLGDLVGYGGEPVAVLEQVRTLVRDEDAIVLKGNHDAMAVNPPAVTESLGSESAGWTHAQLDAAQRAFLDQLPLTWLEGDVLLLHASADAPERWRYVDNARNAALSLDAAVLRGARCVFGGHVHEQTLYYRGAGRGLMRFSPVPGQPVSLPRHRQWLATIGSVGQPRDGDPRAMYAVFDAVDSILTFHRVVYDHPSAAAAIRLAGLPEHLARRLEMGR